MPPRAGLGQLPFWPSNLFRSTASRQPVASVAPFTTSAPLLKQPGAKKSVSRAGPPEKGKRMTVVKKKEPVASQTITRKIDPEERKALRKRIILSNDNALEVPWVLDLEASQLEKDTVDELHGKVLGIPMETVDKLRSVEAFKTNQGWSLYRRPATLMTKETVELAKLLLQAQEDSKTFRRIIHGNRAGGKSTLLLQAMAMSFAKGVLVINFPDARDLVLSHSHYAPLENTNPTQYVQKARISELLKRTAEANEAVLKELRVAQKHPVVRGEATLLDLVRVGANDADLAWPTMKAFWSEINLPSNKNDPALSRPPILFCVDNVSYIMNKSDYDDRNVQKIHAHDLVIVRHLTDLLSGESKFRNGGLVLAATSGSDSPKSETMEYAILLNEAKLAGLPEEDLPQWSPFKKIDEYTFQALKDVEPLEMTGLTKEEARTIMEYYAASGLVRKAVDYNLVGEKWTMSGGGIIGELERACVRQRM
ncbi:mitochondrial 37S ribosomal protein mS29 [Phyllosticta citriasiana]|uniref:Small ribosomal subunit protein mS29 n=1 Tax=Phyllosticta citriasiana TaxID=595635 RepID=A0ABR1KIA9_9PEZI